MHMHNLVVNFITFLDLIKVFFFQDVSFLLCIEIINFLLNKSIILKLIKIFIFN